MSNINFFFNQSFTKIQALFFYSEVISYQFIVKLLQVNQINENNSIDFRNT